MGSDFVDRAKLEALAEEHAPALNSDDEELTYPRSALRGFKRSSFLAGAAAYAALLDAETTEEWGVENDVGGVYTEDLAQKYAAHDGERLMKRRVLYGPWLPSEGGEKRG